MRILDCKEKKCKQLNQGAPVIIDYLCEECNTHFENVKKSLDTLKISYIIDPGIVRGLDYYTKTVFEFVSETEGYTVLAGGRYDGLVQELGGQKTEAIGFAMGEDRLIDIFEKYNQTNEVAQKTPSLYIASIGEIAEEKLQNLALALRKNGIYIETDICARSMKASLKYADKTKSKYLLVIGEDEVNTNTAKIKNMQTGEEMDVKLEVENIIKEILK